MNYRGKAKMSHVPTFLTLLVLLAVSNIAASTESSPASMAIKCLSANCEKRMERQSSVVRTATGKPKVSISTFNQKALIDKDVEVSWEYLTELEDYNIFTPEEQAAAEELLRLGIRILATKCAEGLKLRYRGTVAVGVDTLPDEGEKYNELYKPQNSMEVDDGTESIWTILRHTDARIVSRYLIFYIMNNQLFGATLLLKARPDAANYITDEIYSRQIITTLNPLKHLIFRNSPRLFMEKFLQVHEKSDYNCPNRLSALSRVLTDLKIGDETVQEAFDFLIKEVENAPIQVLACFVNSRRPLTIDHIDMDRIIFSGIENVKERVILLKLIKDRNFIEKVVLKCFTSGAYSRLAKGILFDWDLLKHLNATFTLSFLNNLIQYDRYRAMKFILSTELMTEVKSKTPNFGKTLADSVEFVGLESFQVLVQAKMIKTNVPIFNHTDIMNAALKLIKKKKKFELLQYLVKERFIAAGQKVTLKSGRAVSLLTVAILENNIEFINLFDKFDHNLCENINKEISPNEITAEMTKLLESKGINFFCDVDDIPLATYRTKENLVSSPSTPSPKLKRSFEGPLSTTDSTFETPELKKRRMPVISGNTRTDYLNALVAQDDEMMHEILNQSRSMNMLKSARGQTTVIWELYDRAMIKSLNYCLDTILSKDVIIQVVKESIEKESDYVIKYLAISGFFAISSDLIDGKNLIAHLFKIRKPEFAFKLIEEIKFDLRASHSPDINPEGDILLFTAWNSLLSERLIEMGASPNVKLYYEPAGSIITLRKWAELTGKTRLLQVLEKYNAK